VLNKFPDNLSSRKDLNYARLSGKLVKLFDDKSKLFNLFSWLKNGISLTLILLKDKFKASNWGNGSKSEINSILLHIRLRFTSPLKLSS